MGGTQHTSSRQRADSHPFPSQLPAAQDSCARCVARVKRERPSSKRETALFLAEGNRAPVPAGSKQVHVYLLQALARSPNEDASRSGGIGDRLDGAIVGGNHETPRVNAGNVGVSRHQNTYKQATQLATVNQLQRPHANTHTHTRTHAHTYIHTHIHTLFPRTRVATRVYRL